jgi:hypothetical protein
MLFSEFFKQAKITLILLILLGFLISCTDQKPISTSIKPSTTQLSCEPYALVPNDSGYLYNNVWNKDAAKYDLWQQCLEIFSADNQDYPGWSWNWPQNNNTIFAYPQVKRGSSPWDPNSNDPQFPLPIDRLKQLSLNLDMKISSNGEQNLATTMWIVDSPIKQTSPNSAIIEAEIMIWTYRTPGHMQPGGSVVDEVNLSGLTWEVWAQRNWGDVSGENSNRWTYLAFRLKDNQLSITLDLLGILKWAVTNDYIKREGYVADVETGNEIQSGQGFTIVKQFELGIELDQ